MQSSAYRMSAPAQHRSDHFRSVLACVDDVPEGESNTQPNDARRTPEVAEMGGRGARDTDPRSHPGTDWEKVTTVRPDLWDTAPCVPT